MHIIVADNNRNRTQNFCKIVRQLISDKSDILDIHHPDSLQASIKTTHHLSLIFLHTDFLEKYKKEVENYLPKFVPIVFWGRNENISSYLLHFNTIALLDDSFGAEEIKKIIEKYQNISFFYKNQLSANDFHIPLNNYKTRFLVKYGEKMQHQTIEQIAYFYVEDKSCFLMNTQGRRFLIEQSLEHLEKLLNPKLFFRVSRNFIVKIDSIKEFKSFKNSRLKLFLEPSTNSEVIVSRERVSAFKQWIDQ
ncbi:MAG: LytTR family DNA-binding domain-containing protein [Thermonemataceae bacterium]|nr:LytTR family DNA-binding domain-containing protein [Thermonemataceae bacterium]